MASPKDQYACARICVEVNLEAGLPEAIKLTVGNWSHFQNLDYEQLPFKCRGCHEYGHFICNCPQKPKIQQDNEEGWHTVKIIKTKTKPREAQRKGEGNKEPRVISLEGSQEMQKTNEMRDETNDSEEKSSNDEIKDLEAALSDQTEKYHIHSDAGAEVIKEGEILGKSEEESESGEEEEEEGEIEMTTPRKKEKPKEGNQKKK